MSPRPRGRPPGKATLTPEAVLAAAMEMLDRDGVAAVTMRGLAARLGVTPMAIYHHFADRDALLRALAERAYAEVAVPETGAPRERIVGLLLSYRAQVEAHPGLTLAIFSRAEVFPEAAQRISDQLVALLHDHGLAPERARLWLDILVDFTHGAALAIALRHDDSATPAAGYPAALEELLDAL